MAFHILISPTFDENQTIMFFSLSLKIAMVTSVLLFRVGFSPSLCAYIFFSKWFFQGMKAPPRENYPSHLVLSFKLDRNSEGLLSALYFPIEKENGRKSLLNEKTTS